MNLVRTNLILTALLVASALGLVTSQHKTRRMVTHYEQELARSRTLDVEFGQLQIEQGTHAKHAVIERVAADKLRMRPIDSSRTIILQKGERK